MIKRYYIEDVTETTVGANIEVTIDKDKEQVWEELQEIINREYVKVKKAVKSKEKFKITAIDDYYERVNEKRVKTGIEITTSLMIKNYYGCFSPFFIRIRKVKETH